MSGGKRNDRPFRWDGKRVLITGGSSGIGKHLAANLVRQGAHVAIVADDPKKLLDAEVGTEAGFARRVVAPVRHRRPR